MREFENFLVSNFETFSIFTVGLILLIIWAVVIKGVALWKSARNSQRNWFIAMLIFNTAGILELFYIVFWQKQHARLDRRN